MLILFLYGLQKQCSLNYGYLLCHRQALPPGRAFFFYMNLTLPEAINSSALVKPWLTAWRFVIMSKSRLQIRHLHGFLRLAFFDGQ